MTQNQNNLACLLLSEYFGDIVTKVGRCLMIRGLSSIREILQETEESSVSVKNSLSVLIKHNFVSFELSVRNFVLYRINVEKVLSILRYSQFIEIARKLFDVDGERIISELILEGQLTLEEIRGNVNKKFPDEVLNVNDKFKDLVDDRFIERCAVFTDESQDQLIPILTIQEEYRFVIPHELLVKRDTTEERLPKRLKVDDSCAEKKLYWKLNTDRFDLYLRDQIIIDGITTKFDQSSGIIIESLLKIVKDSYNPWCDVSSPISKLDIINNLSHKIPSHIVDQYLSYLVDDSARFLTKVGIHQGGSYTLQVKSIITSLAWSLVENIVEERFSSKHCRIFRLLRIKQHLEQAQIETLAMIPPKDAKEITYALFKENFIQVHEVPQTPDYAPARTYYLFCIKFPQVVRMLLEWCLKSCSNLKMRREFEAKQCKRVLEKYNKIDAIITTLKSQNAEPNQISEIESMLTPPEVVQIDKVNSSFDRLELGNLRLLDCILIFQSYIRFCSSKETK